MKNSCSFLFLIFLLGCQTEPTKIYEQHLDPIPSTQLPISPEIQITKATVVLDAREPFAYAMAHIPGSINLSWREFVDHEDNGALKSDLFAAARRLARLGIGPNTAVVTVGLGKLGKGDEGRLAWTLIYLGVKNVNFASVNGFKYTATNQMTPPKRNVAIWKPELDDSMIANREDVRRFLGIGGPLRNRPKHTGVNEMVVVDVRTPFEHLSPVSAREPSMQEMGAINIPWVEFIQYDGRPNPEVINQLRAFGVSDKRQIVLLSQNGIESATALLVLRSFGFTQVTHYPSGLRGLLN